ncbi:MinD-like ATPase involved in chromosome partitioning or flagellar assembly [Clavibacter michiganensis]|uniref:ATPase n=1 Tax=Clavibacter michiganensis TaxID=28447 RepID=UPI00195B08A3|nr:ATPase [Clavibacter michiganensis]MBM7412077.1 MinD-like ATPase involved in chromosome partitioning or flagellar assembly [Clavibacter michiganensis]
MTDDTQDTGHRDGGASEPPLLSRRELRRRQQEMERTSAEPSGDAHRWVDPFPAVPRTSEGGLFGPDRVRPGAAPVEARAPEAAAPEIEAAEAEADEEVVVGTHAFDELFDDAEDDDVDPEDRVPAAAPAAAPVPAEDDDADDARPAVARPAVAPTPFDAVVSPEAGSAWTVPAPHVVNAHPFRMPLRPSAEASGPEPADAERTPAPAGAAPVDDAPPVRPAAAVEPQPTPVASLPAAPDDVEEPADAPRPGTDLTAFPDADPQRYVMRTPRADAATSALTLFPEQTGQRPPRGPAIARTGFRGFMNTVTGGVFKIGPGAEEAAANAEVARREGDERIIRQATWSRAVSVLVANRKGGVGKTPTSLILGGVLGSIRGGSVAVVEVTDDPGALGYRAEGQPTRGLGELVRDRDEIHSAGQLAGYTAPQTSFASVVASVGPRRELTGDDVIGVARLIDEYYGMRVMDSGNQPSSSAFRGAIEVTDVLVVPVLNAGDAVLEAVALLDFLRELGGHAAMLADNAVIIRLHDGRPEDPAVVARIDRILDDARPAQIFTVPYDAHIAERGPISLASLDPVVARAFTAATAGVVQRLAHAVR